jgi:hypothetical protein
VNIFVASHFVHISRLNRRGTARRRRRRAKLFIKERRAQNGARSAKIFFFDYITRNCKKTAKIIDFNKEIG